MSAKKNLHTVVT